MQRRNDGQGRYGRPAYGPQQDQAWEQQPIYEARPMDQMDDPYAEYPYEEVPQEPYDDETPVEEPEVIATNGTVKLTCTLAAFCSLLALFFAFADKRSWPGNSSLLGAVVGFGGGAHSGGCGAGVYWRAAGRYPVPGFPDYDSVLAAIHCAACGVCGGACAPDAGSLCGHTFYPAADWRAAGSSF